MNPIIGGGPRSLLADGALPSAPDDTRGSHPADQPAVRPAGARPGAGHGGHTADVRRTAIAVAGALCLAGCASAPAQEPSPPPRTSPSATASRSPAPAHPTGGKTPARRHLPGVPLTFTRVRDAIPGALFEIRYAGEHNFLGRPVRGYSAPECWLTRPAVRALAQVERRVARDGYRLKIYDCFRPQRSVDEFMAWAADPDDTTTQREFYPRLAKDQLFPQGYIAAQSGHSRGSTVDVTLVRKGHGVSPTWRVGDRQVSCTVRRRFPDTSIDMGTGFDCFDPVANTANRTITATQRAHRRYLVRQMHRAGFTNLPEEWWHFTLRREPYPDTFFDTEITRGQ